MFHHKFWQFLGILCGNMMIKASILGGKM